VKDKQQTIIKQQPSVITLKKIGVAMLITVAALSVTMQFSASKKVRTIQCKSIESNEDIVTPTTSEIAFCFILIVPCGVGSPPLYSFNLTLLSSSHCTFPKQQLQQSSMEDKASLLAGLMGSNNLHEETLMGSRRKLRSSTSASTSAAPSFESYSDELFGD
jgi:hypothetical protein